MSKNRAVFPKKVLDNILYKCIMKKLFFILCMNTSFENSLVMKKVGRGVV